MHDIADLVLKVCHQQTCQTLESENFSHHAKVFHYLPYFHTLYQKRIATPFLCIHSILKIHHFCFLYTKWQQQHVCWMLLQLAIEKEKCQNWQVCIARLKIQKLDNAVNCWKILIVDWLRQSTKTVIKTDW